MLIFILHTPEIKNAIRDRVTACRYDVVLVLDVFCSHYDGYICVHVGCRVRERWLTDCNKITRSITEIGITTMCDMR